MYRAVVRLVGQSTWYKRWGEGLALMIPEGPLVCDDALGAPPTSPFELYKPGDRRNVFRFRAVTPPPRGSAPAPETSPSSSAGPLGAPPADGPTPFPDASRSSRIPAGGRCAC